MTPNHPLYINEMWKHAGDAVVGDYLLGNDGEFIQIESIERIYEQVPTYNFDIAATYVVITDPFLRDYEGHNGTDKFTSLLHRFIYNVPFLHKLFLESWFYTNLAPYNSHRGATIVINFD